MNFKYSMNIKGVETEMLLITLTHLKSLFFYDT